jgi:hypothetical protein
MLPPMHRALLAGISALLVSSTALAQTDAESRAAAETLFRDAKTAFDAGDYATACPKLEGAYALTGGEALGGALFLARCYEKQGKIASAWGVFTEVAGKAAAAGQTERAAQAASGAAALRPRLHYVSLRVPEAVAAIPEAQIHRQGKPLRRELWASRFPVDPGTLTLDIAAPGKRTATRVVPIPDAPGETPITLDALVDSAASAPAAGSLPPLSAAPERAPPPLAALDRDRDRDLDRDPWSGPRVAGVVIAAIGVAGMGVGVGVGAAARGEYKAAVADATNCSPLPGGGAACTDLGPTEEARRLGNLGTVTFLASAGVAVAGGLMILLAPSRPRAAVSSPRLPRLPSLAVGRDGAAITWMGAY